MNYPLVPGKRLLRGKEMKSMQLCGIRGVKRLRSKDGDDQDYYDDDSSDDDNNYDASFTGLPVDLICTILSFLDAPTLLLRIRPINRSFRTLASQKSAGWTDLCQRLWKTKVHVAKEAREHPDPMAAYRISILDARNRDYVHQEEELVYDPETRKGTVWSFRFKEAAGADWTSWDPWFNGEAARKMVFLPDGSVKQFIETTTGDANGGPCAATSSGALTSPSFPRRGTLSDPPTTMTWRFVTMPLDLPARQMGSYIRITVGGRDVPTYCVRRSPTKNWGFIMESCWGVFASFEFPKRPTAPQPRRRTRLLRRAHDTQGNWHNVEVFVDDDGEDGEDLDRHLVDDESFAVTSGLQWREAFLYNFGARVLPEGENAVADFERTYGAALL